MSLYERKGWFRIELPEGWETAEEEGTLSLSRADGPGALQLTVREGPRGGKPGQKVDPYLLLRAFAAQTGVDFELAAPRRWTSGPLDWAACEWTAEEPFDGAQGGKGEPVAWRAWMATNQDLLAFATYASPVDARDQERAAVDSLLAGLELF
ncbi:MAG TPA: hypothetical protein VF950_27780 [Planctomycetota bacterium]